MTTYSSTKFTWPTHSLLMHAYRWESQHDQKQLRIPFVKVQMQKWGHLTYPEWALSLLVVASLLIWWFLEGSTQGWGFGINAEPSPVSLPALYFSLYILSPGCLAHTRLHHWNEADESQICSSRTQPLLWVPIHVTNLLLDISTWTSQSISK